MLRSIWLGVRNLLMIALFPGTVAVYIPYRILGAVDFPGLSAWSVNEYPGAAVVLCGTGILLSCVWSFAHIGRGTLAPFDETRKLVVVGLYRYVRNPMYIGVVLILMGESLFFFSGALLIYSVIVFALFNAVIMGYEEVRLRMRFGDEYHRYCRLVGRWLPGKGFSDAH